MPNFIDRHQNSICAISHGNSKYEESNRQTKKKCCTFICIVQMTIQMLNWSALHSLQSKLYRSMKMWRRIKRWFRRLNLAPEVHRQLESCWYQLTTWWIPIQNTYKMTQSSWISKWKLIHRKGFSPTMSRGLKSWRMSIQAMPSLAWWWRNLIKGLEICRQYFFLRKQRGKFVCSEMMICLEFTCNQQLKSKLIALMMWISQ